MIKAGQYGRSWTVPIFMWRHAEIDAEGKAPRDADEQLGEPFAPIIKRAGGYI